MPYLAGGVREFGGRAIAAQGRAPSFDMQYLFEAVRIPKIVLASGGAVVPFATSCHLVRRSEAAAARAREPAEAAVDDALRWSGTIEITPPATTRAGMLAVQ